MDTIFAPICPLGGSIVSVRFSGKNAFDVLDFFEVSKALYEDENNKDRSLFFTKLLHQGRVFDEVVAKVFREPNSFTGENVVEIDLHASRILLEDFLHLASTINGFRFAKNGEFSKRAFFNGKMDLMKCEGIDAIIKAETRQQQKLANSMFSGDLSKKYAEIREKLIQALSLVETNIDFAEEEVPQNIVAEVKNVVEELKNIIQKSLEQKNVVDKINNGFVVAIIGSPNVGKSSLINWIAKREIAIVSPIAGTTRDILSADVDFDGYKATFYDTAGLRESSDLVEQYGVQKAKEIADNADLCVIMFDDAVEYEKNKQFYCDKYKNLIFVINKSDTRDKKTKSEDVVEISVKNNENLDVLMKNIKNELLKNIDVANRPLFTNERHYILLKECLQSLEVVDFDTMPIEIIGEEMRNACNKIGQITGEIYADDVLDNIFSKFCIGK